MYNFVLICAQPKPLLVKDVGYLRLNGILPEYTVEGGGREGEEGKEEEVSEGYEEGVKELEQITNID